MCSVKAFRDYVDVFAAASHRDFHTNASANLICLPLCKLVKETDGAQLAELVVGERRPSVVSESSFDLGLDSVHTHCQHLTMPSRVVDPFARGDLIASYPIGMYGMPLRMTRDDFIAAAMEYHRNPGLDGDAVEEWLVRRLRPGEIQEEREDDD